MVLQINLRSKHQRHKFWIIKGLQEKLIFGTNFLQWHNILYDATSRTLLQGDPAQGIIAIEEAMTLPALSTNLM